MFLCFFLLHSQSLEPLDGFYSSEIRITSGKGEKDISTYHGKAKNLVLFPKTIHYDTLKAQVNQGHQNSLKIRPKSNKIFGFYFGNVTGNILNILNNVESLDLVQIPEKCYQNIVIPENLYPFFSDSFIQKFNGRNLCFIFHSAFNGKVLLSNLSKPYFLIQKYIPIQSNATTIDNINASILMIEATPNLTISVTHSEKKSAENSKPWIFSTNDFGFLEQNNQKLDYQLIDEQSSSFPNTENSSPSHSSDVSLEKGTNSSNSPQTLDQTNDTLSIQNKSISNNESSLENQNKPISNNEKSLEKQNKSISNNEKSLEHQNFTNSEKETNLNTSYPSLEDIKSVIPFLPTKIIETSYEMKTPRPIPTISPTFSIPINQQIEEEKKSETIQSIPTPIPTQAPIIEEYIENATIFDKIPNFSSHAKTYSFLANEYYHFPITQPYSLILVNSTKGIEMKIFYLNEKEKSYYYVTSITENEGIGFFFGNKKGMVEIERKNNEIQKIRTYKSPIFPYSKNPCIIPFINSTFFEEMTDTSLIDIQEFDDKMMLLFNKYKEDDTMLKETDKKNKQLSFRFANHFVKNLFNSFEIQTNENGEYVIHINENNLMLFIPQIPKTSFYFFIQHKNLSFSMINKIMIENSQNENQKLFSFGRSPVFIYIKSKPHQKILLSFLKQNISTKGFIPLTLLRKDFKSNTDKEKQEIYKTTLLQNLENTKYWQKMMQKPLDVYFKEFENKNQIIDEKSFEDQPIISDVIKLEGREAFLYTVNIKNANIYMLQIHETAVEVYLAKDKENVKNGVTYLTKVPSKYFGSISIRDSVSLIHFHHNADNIVEIPIIIVDNTKIQCDEIYFENFNSRLSEVLRNPINDNNFYDFGPAYSQQDHDFCFVRLVPEKRANTKYQISFRGLNDTGLSIYESNSKNMITLYPYSSPLIRDFDLAILVKIHASDCSSYEIQVNEIPDPKDKYPRKNYRIHGEMRIRSDVINTSLYNVDSRKYQTIEIRENKENTEKETRVYNGLFYVPTPRPTPLATPFPPIPNPTYDPRQYAHVNIEDPVPVTVNFSECSTREIIIFQKSIALIFPSIEGVKMNVFTASQEGKLKFLGTMKENFFGFFSGDFKSYIQVFQQTTDSLVGYPLADKAFKNPYFLKRPENVKEYDFSDIFLDPLFVDEALDIESMKRYEENEFTEFLPFQRIKVQFDKSDKNVRDFFINNENYTIFFTEIETFNIHIFIQNDENRLIPAAYINTSNNVRGFHFGRRKGAIRFKCDSTSQIIEFFLYTNSTDPETFPFVTEDILQSPDYQEPGDEDEAIKKFKKALEMKGKRLETLDKTARGEISDYDEDEEEEINKREQEKERREDEEINSFKMSHQKTKQNTQNDEKSDDDFDSFDQQTKTKDNIDDKIDKQKSDDDDFINQLSDSDAPQEEAGIIEQQQQKQNDQKQKIKKQEDQEEESDFDLLQDKTKNDQKEEKEETGKIAREKRKIKNDDDENEENDDADTDSSDKSKKEKMRKSQNDEDNKEDKKQQKKDERRKRRRQKEEESDDDNEDENNVPRVVNVGITYPPITRLYIRFGIPYGFIVAIIYAITSIYNCANLPALEQNESQESFRIEFDPRQSPMKQQQSIEPQFDNQSPVFQPFK